MNDTPEELLVAVQRLTAERDALRREVANLREKIEAYRRIEVVKAMSEFKKARAAYESATSRKARLAADEQLQFWGKKVSFLNAVRTDD